MKLSIKTESWPIKGHFTISRSSLTEVDVVTVKIESEAIIGRGECRPYARYNETTQSVTDQIETLRADIEMGLTPYDLQSRLPTGAARNAIDCALWDFKCKKEGQSIYNLINRPHPSAQPTAFTLSVDSPEIMAKAAIGASSFNILKLKVDGDRIFDQIQAVAQTRPDCRLIIDANEALQAQHVYALATHPNAAQIALIEQPLHDNIIRKHSFQDYDGPPLCADESFHGIDDLLILKSLGYKAVNIKLDKCGGFTAALDLIKVAKEQGFHIMGGCMLSTSLAVAPMAALMNAFDIIDLDGGALLARDREHGLTYKKGRVYPPSSKLWG